jgi:hypothetical protein
VLLGLLGQLDLLGLLKAEAQGRVTCHLRLCGVMRRLLDLPQSGLGLCGPGPQLLYLPLHLLL